MRSSFCQSLEPIQQFASIHPPFDSLILDVIRNGKRSNEGPLGNVQRVGEFFVKFRLITWK
jgi:hypothetical protein